MCAIKCPFCQKELEIWHTNRVRIYACPDLTCKGYYMSATKDMWQELIRTRKALEIIKKEMSNEYMPDFAVIRDALKTALEQKD